jgi:hypothetical protein
VVIGNGTSSVKFVAPGTASNVLTSNGTAWVSQAAAAGGGDYIMAAYVSPATWTKPAGLKAVKVTVVGAGGNGGVGTNAPGINYGGGNGGGGGAAILYLDAPAVPGPITVTVGSAPSKTSSFGPLVSATGGTNGAATPGSADAPVGPYAGGTGSGGTVNVPGGPGRGTGMSAGNGGAAALGFGAGLVDSGGSGTKAGINYGGGAIGSSNPTAGAAGGAGIVIVEEFY